MITWPCGCIGTTLQQYIQNGCPEHGKPPDRLTELVKEFWKIVDAVECSDEGRYFHPTELQFSSCRTISGMRLGKIIDEMKAIVGAPPRATDKELRALNCPDDSNDCDEQDR